MWFLFLILSLFASGALALWISGGLAVGVGIFFWSIGGIGYENCIKAFRSAWSGERDLLDSLILMRELIDVSQFLRKEGMLGLDTQLKNISHPLLKEYLKKISLGIEGENMVSLLRLEKQKRISSLQSSIQVLVSLSQAGPAIGVSVSLVLLVSLLMKGQSEGLGEALLPTLYGLILGEVFFSAMCSRLKNFIPILEQQYDLLITGLSGIIQGRAPLVLESELKTIGS